MAYRIHKGRVVREATANEKAIAQAIPRKDYQALNGAGTMSEQHGQPADREALTKKLNELFSESHKLIHADFVERHKARDATEHPQFQIVYSSALIQLAAMLLIDAGFDPQRYHAICLESYQRAYAAAPKFA